MKETLQQVCKAFCLEGRLVSYDEIKVGNVNRTYKVNYELQDGEQKSYIVQRINTYVFKRPDQVMANIDRVTAHIREKTPDKVCLHFHHTPDRKTFVMEEDGFWRLFNYIPSITYNVCDNLEVVENGGEAFGEFQMLLSDFDASQLYYTIPDFHDTKKRFQKLINDAKEDPCGKVAEVRGDLDWLLSVREKACTLTELYERGELPLRVTHNDTKINNVLFDCDTNKALAVIDLDTVMPGLVGHDFGDAIRFAANYVDEDCKDEEKVGVNMDVFRAFTTGFLKQTAKTLNHMEVDTLALSCFVLAVELSTRFLDDYILGNPYFKINYPEHNLIRARCQIALAKDMLRKMPEMEAIVHESVERFV